MGNQKSQTKRQNKIDEVILPHSSLLDIILSETIYVSDSVKAFKASDLNQKDAINLHIFPQGSFSTTNNNDQAYSNMQAWNKWITFYKELHHPWVLKIILCKMIEKEIGIREFYQIILISEEYTMTLGQLLEPWLRSPSLNNRRRAHSLSNKSQREDTVIERRSKSQEKVHLKRVFDEKSILKLVFSVIDALIYCYEKGFLIEISTKNIFYCKNSDRFLISPFALDSSKNILNFYQYNRAQEEQENQVKKKKQKLNKRRSPQDEDRDLFYFHDLEIKKQIFSLGLIALKMATLIDIPRNLLVINKHLLNIKGEFPDIEKILRIIFYEIFTDDYDIKSLLKHPLNDCIYSNFLYKDFGKQRNIFVERNQGLIEVGKAYNILENHSAAIQSLQKVVSDYTNKQELTLTEEIRFAEVLKIFGESYIQTNLTELAQNDLKRCTQLLDRIVEAGGEIHPNETYCDIAKLYLIMKDYKQAIVLLEKASQWYERNNDDKINNHLENWKQTERELLQLKEGVYGRNSFELATSLERLADIYTRLGELKVALEYRKELMKRYDTNKEKYITKIMQNDWKIGELHLILNEFDESIKAYERCYELRMAKLGEESSETIRSLFRLGELCELTKEVDKAIIWYKKAMDATEKLEGKGMKKEAKLRECLTKCYEIFGDIDGAVKWQRETLKVMEEDKTDKSIAYAIKVYEFARMLEIQKDYHESFIQYRKCLETMIHNGFAKKDLCDQAEEGIQRTAVHL